MAKSLIKRTKELFSRGRSKGDDAKNDASKENEDSSPSSTAAAPQQIAATESPPTGADGDDVILAPVLIVGAGIVGLVLALALDKYCGLKVELYEQAQAFADDVGAGMGMYPNGLRVIRDISPDLLKQIQEAGFPYLLRRFEVRMHRQKLDVGGSDRRASLLFLTFNFLVVFLFIVSATTELKWPLPTRRSC